MTSARAMLDSLGTGTSIGFLALSLTAAYFLGHILLWLARAGKPNENASKSSLARVLGSLAFRVPKPPHSYDPELQPLYDAVQRKFSVGGKPLPWRQFYPVVKSYLSKHLSNSLVATYQNKYTLHRSLTTGAAVWFWLNVLGLVSGGLLAARGGASPLWGLLAVLCLLALALVWGFSGSYMYHWQLYGDTIVTEAYASIHGPNDSDGPLSPRNLVVIDIETSGPNPFRHEILAIGLVPFDPDLPSAEIYIKPTQIEWTNYARNNFESFRGAWENEALPPAEACAAVQRYLADTFSGQRATPVGHNVGFDVAFLRRLAFQAGHDQLAGLSHRAIDTHTLLYVLAARGKIPAEAVTSDGAFQHFGIKVNEQARHTAIGDAMATRELLFRILERL